MLSESYRYDELDDALKDDNIILSEKYLRVVLDFKKLDLSKRLIWKYFLR